MLKLIRTNFLVNLFLSFAYFAMVDTAEAASGAGVVVVPVEHPAVTQAHKFDRAAFEAKLRAILEISITSVAELAPIAEAVGLGIGHPEVSSAAALAGHIAAGLEAGIQASAAAAVVPSTTV
jgi:hypothetical protein